MRAISNIVTSEGGIDSTLTVTCSDEFIGETLTCTNGTKSITKIVPSSMNVVFNLSPAGTWVLSNSLTPVTSSYVVDNIEYNAILSNVPDGKTVTPTDDIQIWLHCADIWDKNYTTLSEVLNDNDTLLALITSDNAVDYMVRSTSWAVAPKLIPVMTDDTHPSGVASASSSFSGLYPYYAFDGTTSTWWASASSGIQYIRYKFDNATVINRLYMIGSQMNRSDSIAFQGSNDGSNWTTIKTLDRSAIIAHDQQPYIERVTNNTAYLYYQIYMSTNTLGVSFQELNFFNEDGITENSTAMQYISSYDYAAATLLADSTWCNAICNSEYSESIFNTKVPVMTSNTTPEGECFASAGAEYAYYVFNGVIGDNSSSWGNGVGTSGSVGYKFISPKRMYKVSVWNRNYSTVMAINHYKVQGSNDDFVNDIHDLGSFQNTSQVAAHEDLHALISFGDYQSYRINVQDCYDSQFRIGLANFYGRENGGVQTWLHKAGITNKPYTTLAEVLNDSDTLATLMSNEDAVDYLVTCKGWAVSEALVPTMTSNTTPSGECFASSVNSSYPIYQAFDGNRSTAWGPSSASVPQYIGYKFTSAVVVNNVSILPDANSTGSSVKDFKVQGSTDNNTWVDLYEDSCPYETTATEHVFNFNNTVAFQYYRIYISSKNGSWPGGTSISNLQFYSPSISSDPIAMSCIGANNYAADTLLADSDWCEAICNSAYFESVLNVKVPAMTSNTAPEGVVSAYNNNYSNYPWHAFDGDSTTSSDIWASESLSTWIQYQFTAPKKIKCVRFRQFWNTGYQITAGIIKASNDNVNFTDVKSFTNVPSLDYKYIYLNNNEDSYSYWRMHITAINGTAASLNELQFYGREDV